MEIKELAKMVISTTDRPDRTKKCNYYMLNINHPVISALKRRYCAANNIKPYIPMSDQERTEFELWLFQPSVRQIVENICKQYIDDKEVEMKKNIENGTKKE
jgi:hypothetical protein